MPQHWRLSLVLMTYIHGVVNDIAGLNGIKIEIVMAAPAAPAKAAGVN